MQQDNRVYADQIVWLLRDALYSGRDGLQGVPAMLKKVITEKLWQERVIRDTGEIVTFDSFEEFVKTQPLEGLGADLKLIKTLAGGDPELLDAIDRELQRPHGGARVIESKIDNVNLDSAIVPNGNTAQAAIRRLRKSRPDLHEKVIAGELSPHAAMLEAGYRPKTATIYPDDPDRTAAALIRNLEREHLEAVLETVRGYLENE